MLSALLGWKGYAVVAIATGLAAWWIQGWRYDARVAQLERRYAEKSADAVRVSLDQLLTDINVVAAAGRRAAAVGPALTAEINKLTGALKDAPSLPDDCRPDPVRMRSLKDSVRAANRAAIGRSISGAVPTDP